MYEAYFHLQKRPFAATPDPACFFAPEPVQELVDELVLRAESGQGICVLTAPAGTGKTLVCRHVAAELSGRLTPLYLANANFPTRRALLQSILFELGLRYSGLEEQELRLAVYAALKKLTLARRGAVLIVDEAHLLNDRLLEELRLLASLAEEDQPLARVVLAGQPALEERLVSPVLEALNQRIVCQLWLDPLTREQSIAYIHFRIEWAGGDSARIFTAQALERIAMACNGLPRYLNQLCDHVLLLTYVQELPRVTEEAVDEALRDLKQLPLNWNTPLTADLSEAAHAAAGDALEADDLAVAEGAMTSIVPEGAARACFEIGGPADADDGAEDAESLADYSYLLPGSQARPAPHAPGVAPMSDLLDRQRREIVPAAEPVPNHSRRFAEEPVSDKYAVLDRRLPRFSRTFEDAAVPESWLPPRQPQPPVAPWPPTAGVTAALGHDLADDCSEDLRPDQTIDRMLPWIDKAIESGIGSVETAAAATAGQAPASPSGPLSAALVRPERQSIEAQLGTDVIDACLEVQTAFGSWRETASGYVTTFDAAHSMADAIEDERAAGMDAGYDVIEPGPAEPRSHASAGIRDELEQPLRAGRYVPKPKYRHVFSTLRRRLGNGFRSKD